MSSEEVQLSSFELARYTGHILSKNYNESRTVLSEDQNISIHFMWSEDYRMFFEMIKDQIKDTRLPLMPIELDQSLFNKELYQFKDQHFWHGSLLKLDSILKVLKSSTPNSYVIFTDIDCIFKPTLYNAVLPYVEAGNDMCFLIESNHVNIGFMLFRVCSDVIDFWEMIRAKMIEDPTLDQKYVQELLPNYLGKWCFFDDQLLSCSNMWKGQKPYAMIQLLCSCLGKEFNMAEKIFYAAQHINMEPYMKYVKPEIIPFIYKFQDVLLESQKRQKAAANT